MRFIVANYGSRHAGMLLAHLHSIVTTHPGAAISIYWQDMPAEQVAAMRAVAPEAELIKTNHDFAKEPLQRISSKVVCWARAAEEHQQEARLVFCDADTLVRKNLEGFFGEQGWDVIVTAKPEPVPLNSGVILAQGSDATTAFFRTWRAETARILQSPEFFAQANDPAQPFGGTDQMSLYRMLEYRDGCATYSVSCHGSKIARIQVRPCAILNETNSRELTPETSVVHYKGGWQRILLDGRPFSRFRPRTASWEMLDFFLRTFTQALAIVNRSAARPFTPRDFGIRWPWYYQAGRFNRAAYAAWRLKEAAKRAWLLATGRLRQGM